MKKSKAEFVIAQNSFCFELMSRLHKDILTGDFNPQWDGSSMVNYCRIQQDIIRLRRELNKLNKMLEPYQ